MKLPRATDPRLLSVIAATVTSLACGTNYVYSAWAPQFQQRLKLSSTEINLIGTIANLGMYATGIPLGMMVDSVGPRSGIALAVVTFALGYYPLAKAFDAGPGAFSVPLLCFFSFFTGVGSNSAFSAAIKVAALNYPDTRGTATAFPLAAFGLSAFFFATIALALPHDTPHFLLLLATGTVVLPAISFPFIRVVYKHKYRSLPKNEQIQPLHHGSPPRHRSQIGHADTGAHTASTPQSDPVANRPRPSTDDDGDSESSSLLSTGSSTDMANLEATKSIESDSRDSVHVDIRGFALLRSLEFWQLFILLGLLCGIGLMTINNIGNDATALWRHYEPSVDPAFIAKRQVMHVSILSVCSFGGRLLSGIGSDVLVNKYHQSRFWCLLVSACGFTFAQMLALLIQRPTLLVLVSGITGLSYGLLFGVYPSIIAHTFGVHGLSQNWGTICLAPVVGGNVFNMFYGAIYDRHSSVTSDGGRECLLGKSCYRDAYFITLVSGVIGLLLCLWGVQHENRIHRLAEKKRRNSGPRRPLGREEHLPDIPI